MNQPARITRTTMTILSVGSWGFGVFWAFFTASLPLFLNNFTTSKLVIAIPISLGGVLSCTLPLVVGRLSDRTHTRFGRRRPYVLFGALGLFITLAALPHLESFGAVIALATLLSVFAYIGDTPYLALLPDITPPEQRGTTAGALNFVTHLAGIAYFIVGVQIWDAHPTQTFYIVGLSYLGTMAFTVALIREPRVVHLSQATEGQAARETGLLAYLKSIAAETEAAKFLIAMVFLLFGLRMIWTFITLFVVEEFGVAEGDSLWVFMLGTVVVTVVTIPMGMLGDRLDRKATLFWMLIMWVLSTFLLAFAGDYTQTAIIYAIGAIPFAVFLTVGYAYFLDLVPEERVGEFVGLHQIAFALPQTTAPFIGGYLIDEWGYRFMFTAAALVMVIGVIIFHFVRSPEETRSTLEG